MQIADQELNTKATYSAVLQESAAIEIPLMRFTYSSIELQLTTDGRTTSKDIVS